MDKKKIERGFSKYAYRYAQKAELQNQIGQNLLLQLGSSYTSILDLGCGPGNFLKILRNKHPQSQLAALDMSSAMLQQAQASVDFPVQWIQADMDEYVYGKNRFDLIWANMSLQWSQDPKYLLKQLSQALQDKAELSFSVFGAESFKKFRNAFQTFFPHQTGHLHPFYSAEEWRAFISSAGFQKIIWAKEILREEYMGALDFLHAYQKQGMSAAASDSGRLAVQPFKKMLQAFEAQSRIPSGKIAVEYEVFYIKALR